MSEFLNKLLNAKDPVERNVKCDGLEGKVHFRRISAGERVQIVDGQKVNAEAGKATTIVIDVAESLNSKHLMVLFSTCNEDGSRFFKTIEDVRKASNVVIDCLYEHAYAVNNEDAEAGKV